MSRVFGGCRVLMAAAKVGTKEVAAAPVAASAAPSKLKGFQQPHPVSPAMKKFLGVPVSSRSEVLKKVWEHIKANQLQNPTNKREISCDEKLKSIFNGRDKVGMMEIAKLLSPHFIKSN
ncbi:hypothetical protein OPV22_010560 [Ensete ventricosum]|uniref:DM2 domain-containing protein n=1 Tax=Ensete ventricosum TaxID=4639 RepID=A0AAV8RLG6_ENSVE|nr:hypothetical protein OPV22_010560 [Ensete ventricosum]